MHSDAVQAINAHIAAVTAAMGALHTALVAASGAPNRAALVAQARATYMAALHAAHQTHIYNIATNQKGN